MFENILIAAVSFMAGAIISGFVLNKKVENAKKEANDLKSENSGLLSKIEIFKDGAANEEKLKNLVKEEFSSLAAKVLVEKQQFLTEQSKDSLETFLTPLKEKIKEFQIKVEENSESGKINAATIKEKIEDLVRQNRITCDITEKLSSAISKNSKYRGAMGEMILEKILKSSGLIDKKENPLNGNFETQKGFRPKDGSEGTKIVDAVIYLSEGTKSVVVDSKAPLSEFIGFVDSDNDDEKKKHLDAFMNDVYDRIKELSGKYSNLEGLQTPDFTIMFIPFEYPLTYIYSNSALIEHAISENIIIAGPSTLIATLRTIKYSWSQKNQYENIQEITKLGKSIYEKCFTMIQKIENVQTSFDTVRKKFDDLFATVKGKGGLIGQIEKLKEMGIEPSKKINEKYLEENLLSAAQTVSVGEEQA